MALWLTLQLMSGGGTPDILHWNTACAPYRTRWFSSRPWMLGASDGSSAFLAPQPTPSPLSRSNRRLLRGSVATSAGEATSDRGEAPSERSENSDSLEKADDIALSDNCDESECFGASENLDVFLLSLLLLFRDKDASGCFLRVVKSVVVVVVVVVSLVLAVLQSAGFLAGSVSTRALTDCWSVV